MAQRPDSARNGRRDQEIRRLRSQRPRDRFVRTSLASGALLMLGAWGFGGFDWGDLLTSRRLENLARFGRELRPHPLADQSWDWSVAWQWAAEIFQDRGGQAFASTLEISLIAILLAAVWSLPLAPAAARNFAVTDPFLPRGRSLPWLPRTAWWMLRGLVRAFSLVLRSMPEYVIAFLLLAMLGPSPWVAIVALALHNAGILGRLGAESVENVSTRDLRSLRALGAGRVQIGIWSILPEVWPRMLLFFFYRWETCIREATVLGLLGILSLGFWIDDARTRGQMDVLFYFVVLGAVIVGTVDLLSSLARGLVRRAR